MGISICIATYNGEKYIKEQLDSILCQLNINDEIIVSDDSSTDRTLSIIESYNDDRIKILVNQKFHSPIYNFENAIKKATGQYIFLCDQDDIWLPNKVKSMMHYLSDYDLVVSNCMIVDADLRVISNSFFREISSGNGFWRNWVKNTYLGCCMAFNRSICSYILPFPQKIAMHDIWIGLSVELHGASLFLDQPLMLYRRHGGNVSFGAEKSEYSFIYKVQYRMYMLFQLLKRKYWGR